MPNLNNRLLKIASLINQGERVADIGTDHAYLPIYLRQSGISPLVLACDIGEGPLACAKKNVALSGIDGVDFRLCDGLLGIETHEVDAVVIAGMGGELIANILASSWAEGSEKHFLLQPMNSPEYLREYLYKNGFTITGETAVFDAGRVYTVLDVLAKPDSEKREDSFFFLGLLDPKNDCDRLFLEKQYKRLRGCADELSATDNREQYLYYFNAARYIFEALEV
ncbi:MAG: SAM-dependent methyltransferase [Clostridia bacterium]|nr:SAM-dependent methyltransferase [Clostridia bacterium]